MGSIVDCFQPPEFIFFFLLIMELQTAAVVVTRPEEIVLPELCKGMFGPQKSAHIIIIVRNDTNGF